MSIIQNRDSLLEVLDDKKLLVFDFDGVLADSVTVKTEAYGAMYEPYGKEIVEAVIDYHVLNGGVSRFDKFRHWEKQFFNREITSERLSEMCRQFADLVVERVVESPSIQGALEFLAQQRSRGLKMTVNSATPSNEIKEIVLRRGIMQYFDAVMGSPDSKSTNLSLSMELFNCNASEVLFFGDAEADLQAASAQAISFIGVGQEIKALMAKNDRDHYAIDDFSVLIQKSALQYNE